MARYDDGNWYGMTLGEFISLLVDAGHDPAVKMRVIEDRDCGIEGVFIRELQVVLIPDGVVVEEIKHCKGIHKTLGALIEGGVVE